MFFVGIYFYIIDNQRYNDLSSSRDGHGELWLMKVSQRFLF